MGMKEWFQRLQPAPLHVVLALSVLHFCAQLIICHVTHALTLLLDSCHMLCNIIALVGCIMTVKYESQMPLQVKTTLNTEADGCSESKSENQKNDIEDKPLSNNGGEKRLRNTFGWTRIEVLMMLGVCVFFASLCFSVVLESLQTLVHIGHMDAMHNPIIVLIMGGIGLLLNGFCYLLIGGYTFHQGSFLHVTANGDVVLEGVVTVASVRQGQRRLSRSRRSDVPPPRPRQRQGFLEALRDIISCLFVILCSVTVYFIDVDYAKYVDPALAIISAVVLLCLTYPYMKESGLILLQTIPNTMNIQMLNKELVNTFPDIVNIHDFHVWQLTSSKVFSTIHIIFLNPLDYARQCDDVTEFLMKQGITHVTIQPEFISNSSNCNSKVYECLMTCKGKGCITKHCCGTDDSVPVLGPIVIITGNGDPVMTPGPTVVITTVDGSITTPKPSASISEATENVPNAAESVICDPETTT